MGWLFALTDHQLNVIGTLFGALASVATILSFAAANYARLARRDAKKARDQTAHSEYIDGEVRSISVVDYARRAADSGARAVTAGEASRQETADLSEWVRGTGRRRLPTTEVPRPEESSYE